MWYAHPVQSKDSCSRKSIHAVNGPAQAANLVHACQLCSHPEQRQKTTTSLFFPSSCCGHRLLLCQPSAFALSGLFAFFKHLLLKLFLSSWRSLLGPDNYHLPQILVKLFKHIPNLNVITIQVYRAVKKILNNEANTYKKKGKSEVRPEELTF